MTETAHSTADAPRWVVTAVVALRPAAAPVEPPASAAAQPQPVQAPAEPPASAAAQPLPPAPERHLLALLYFCEGMSRSDGRVALEERQMVNLLAQMARLPDYRADPWYQALDEDTACMVLDNELVRHATLVCMTLVLKADSQRRPEEHAYFTRIRKRLGAEPVRVPINLERHKYSALSCVRAVIESS
ncbi:MAG: hypothetical protein HY342_06760 [Candidatus Lambdaproteobacteria bacterium]|nr:hypothetical protein [Candidatus Lambdaproteobacteria bacterium]